MHDRLMIELDDRPGELIRVLALIERRQFALRMVQSRVASDATVLELEISGGERDVRNLTAHIEKLDAVRSVRLA